MFLAHAAPEWLGGSGAPANAGEALPEAMMTIAALPFLGLQCQDAGARAPAFMAGLPDTLVLHSEPGSLATGADDLPRETDPNPNISRPLFNLCKLIFG